MNPISFSQILGNETIKRHLEAMISKRAIGHALLFAGPDGIGKSLFAWALAACVMAEYGASEAQLKKIQSGQHPDIHVYRPEGKLGLHSIQALRQLSQEVYLPPYEASWKVFIIHEAERMLSYSANALLKTFEEPPPRTLIILLSHAHSALLPTILSRCRHLYFHPLSFEVIKEWLQQKYSLEVDICTKIAHQSQGSLGRAVRLAQQGGEATRLYLLKLLASPPLGNYRALQEAVQVLNEQLEGVRKQAEALAKEERNKIPTDQLSAQQQSLLEKELEGWMAILLAQEAQVIFEHILSWYRDASLLLMGGSSTYLMNRDFHLELEQMVQRGDLKPFGQVYEAVQEAHLALQRSTPLPICLETLFLKLDRVS